MGSIQSAAAEGDAPSKASVLDRIIDSVYISSANSIVLFTQTV
jgi:hypothetical protein